MNKKLTGSLIGICVSTFIIIVISFWQNSNARDITYSGQSNVTSSHRARVLPTAGTFQTNGRLFVFSQLESGDKAYIRILDANSNVVKIIKDDQFSYHYGNFGKDRFYYVRFDHVEKRSDLFSCSDEITNCKQIYSTVGSIANPAELENGKIIFQFAEYKPKTHKKYGFGGYNFYLLREGSSVPKRIESEPFGINGPVFVYRDKIHFSATFTVSNLIVESGTFYPTSNVLREISDENVVEILRSTPGFQYKDGSKFRIDRNDFIAELSGETIKFSRVKEHLPFTRSVSVSNILPLQDRLVLSYETSEFSGRYVRQVCIVDLKQSARPCTPTDINKTNPAVHNGYVYRGHWNEKLNKLDIIKSDLRSLVLR